jgi:hypothetical protein
VMKIASAGIFRRIKIRSSIPIHYRTVTMRPGLAGRQHAGRRHRLMRAMIERASDRPVGSIPSLEIHLGKQNASAAHLFL